MVQKNSKILWITWENQRRSLELSNAFGAEYIHIKIKGSGLWRYFLLITKTFMLLRTNRPKIVFVQNPSLVLAAFVCLIKYFYNFKVIVDRHSNFIFSKEDAKSYSKIEIFIGNILSNFSIKNAEITIVTNKFIKDIVKNTGGNAYILQDKIPLFNQNLNKFAVSGRYNIIFPCTFSPDEPIEAVIDAANFLKDDIKIYITGNNSKFKQLTSISLPPNVIFTGFLDDYNYISLMKSCDIVLALTTREHTLLCCAYEAVSAEKPFVISDKKDLLDYFSKGRVVCSNTSKSISDGINCLLKNENYREEVIKLKNELSVKWDINFKLIMEEIYK